MQIGAAGGRCGCVVGVCAPTPMLHLLLLLLLLLVLVLVVVLLLLLLVPLLTDACLCSAQVLNEFLGSTASPRR